MRSQRAKVLQDLCGRPMIHYAAEAAQCLQPERTLVIIGHEADRVRESLQGFPVEFALQAEQKGTGHALMQALPALKDFQGDVVVFYGDTPLVTGRDLEAVISGRERSGADLALLTAKLESPGGYGRVVRRGSEIDCVVEESDATPEQKQISEVNPGIYCFRSVALRLAMQGLDNRNVQGEYYLTDAIALLRNNGRKVVAVPSAQPENLLGINTRADLARAAKQIWLHRAQCFMLDGVTILDPDSFFASHQIKIGRDAVIYPNVFLEGTTEIGEGATLFPNSRIVDSRIGARARILDGCLISESLVGEEATVGPFAHLRAHAEIGAHCRIGNFVEVKNSKVGDKAKSAHLTYLGDAHIGEGANIGAGTITCNYDGFSKNQTFVGDGAFIGSGTELVAPVRIGEGAYVAAGSTITQDVPPRSLGIARSRQVNKEGWVKKGDKKKTADK